MWILQGVSVRPRCSRAFISFTFAQYLVTRLAWTDHISVWSSLGRHGRAKRRRKMCLLVELKSHTADSLPKGERIL